MEVLARVKRHTSLDSCAEMVRLAALLVCGVVHAWIPHAPSRCALRRTERRALDADEPDDELTSKNWLAMSVEERKAEQADENKRVQDGSYQSRGSTEGKVPGERGDVLDVPKI